MRKKILFSTAAVAVMGVASFAAITSNNQPRELSDLELANVEALTEEEIIDTAEPGSVQTCYGTVTEKEGSYIRYCGTCRFVPGTDAWYSLASTCTVK